MRYGNVDMRFTFKQLRYFDAALRLGSIARAADEMNISQSSITAAIDMMEAAIGHPLFRRIPAKGIVPTDTGTAVGRQVAGFLDQCRLFENELMSIEGDPTGTLRMACYAPTAPHVLPVLMKRIAEAYPGIRIDLKEGDMQTISDMLVSGGVDIALTYRQTLVANQPFKPLFHARPFAILPAGWDLAAQPALSLAQLAERPMIMLDLPATQSYFRALFTAEGLEPQVLHTTKSSSVLRGLVAANLGYSILNIHGAMPSSAEAGYVARPLLGDLVEPQYGVAFAPGVERSTMLRVVLDISDALIAEGVFDRLVLRP